MCSRFTWLTGFAFTVAACGGGEFKSGGSTAGGSASEVGGAGTGGSSGLGGSSGVSGASSGGAGATCDNLPLNGLSLLYLCVTTAPTSPSVDFAVQIKSGTPVPLRELTVRYWYPSPSGVTQNSNINYSTGDFNASDVASSFRPTYFELEFPQATGSATPSAPAVLSISLFEPSHGYTYVQAQAWSYNPTLTDFACWDHVTLYRNGVLVFGREP
jgi:endo-1,4-beta-xylanase